MSRPRGESPRRGGGAGADRGVFIWRAWPSTAAPPACCVPAAGQRGRLAGAMTGSRARLGAPPVDRDAPGPARLWAALRGRPAGRWGCCSAGCECTSALYCSRAAALPAAALRWPWWRWALAPVVLASRGPRRDAGSAAAAAGRRLAPIARARLAARALAPTGVPGAVRRTARSAGLARPGREPCRGCQRAIGAVAPACWRSSFFGLGAGTACASAGRWRERRRGLAAAPPRGGARRAAWPWWRWPRSWPWCRSPLLHFGADARRPVHRSVVVGSPALASPGRGGAPAQRLRR
jgi:hypothetical protein